MELKLAKTVLKLRKSEYLLTYIESVLHKSELKLRQIELIVGNIVLELSLSGLAPSFEEITIKCSAFLQCNTLQYALT